MKKMCKDFCVILKATALFSINLLLLIWAHSPILSLSDDFKFTNIVLPWNKCKNKRISLLTLYFGEYVFHFFSYSFSEKTLSIIKKISLSDLPSLKNNEDDDNEDVKNYRQHINTIKVHSNYLNAEYNFICREIDQRSNTITRSDAKIGVFSALAIAMTLIFEETIYYNITQNGYSINKIFFSLILYFLVNIFALLLQHIKIRSFSQYNFRDIYNEKKDIDTILLEKLYYNYGNIKKKADFFSSILCRLYDYLTITILLVISLCITTVLTKDDHLNNYPTKNTELYTLDQNSYLETYNSDHIKLLEILAKLEKKDFQRIVIMTKKTNKELSKILIPYDYQKITYITDQTLTDNVIKILLEN